MTSLHTWAESKPDEIALYLVDQDGVKQTRTWRELDTRSARIAHWLVSQGLQAGDSIAMLMENNLAVLDLAWAARRVGLYYTPINNHLTAPEVAYVLGDCGASLLFTSTAMAPLAKAIGDTLAAKADAAAAPRGYCVDGDLPGYASLEQALQGVDASGELPARPLGRDLLYSSGTTGLPKGVKRPMVPYADRDKPEAEVASWRRAYGFDENAVYLSPAPFYHAAPLRYMMRVTEVGGVSVALAKFDARTALGTIAKYRITHSQWVPTMFVRMLDLPEAERRSFDISSLKVAIHAAAPCPTHVKRQIIEWFGPVVYEYYGGSEGVGVTSINSADWLSHPGSVGRAQVGVPHILDDDGQELPAGQIGAVYFSGGPSFEYHNDPEKTKRAYNAQGWATYGDIGHLDEEGYLYLSDRRADLILSGGVNIYPAEIENVLMQHPAVADVAVIGAPDADFGECVLATVQLHAGHQGSLEMAEQLADFCRQQLSGIKVPRRFVFDHPLPRHENGKLLRRVLKDHFRDTPAGGHAIKNKRTGK